MNCSVLVRAFCKCSILFTFFAFNWEMWRLEVRCHGFRVLDFVCMSFLANPFVFFVSSVSAFMNLGDNGI